MGVILDTSVLIDGERRGEAPEEILSRMSQKVGGDEISISAISVVELTHGIYRATSEARKTRRREFTESIFRSLIIHPVSFEIAQLAGTIEGEQAARGIAISIEDLLIGEPVPHAGGEALDRDVDVESLPQAVDDGDMVPAFFQARRQVRNAERRGGVFADGLGGGDCRGPHQDDGAGTGFGLGGEAQ